MGNVVHQTIPVQVWADIDENVADLVRYLNTLPGVRTYASCQGTIDEGGIAPYSPYVYVGWDSPETLAKLQAEFDIENLMEGPGTFTNNWGALHPAQPIR